MNRAEERDAAGRFMRDARSALADQNQAAAKAYLEKNAKAPGIVARPLKFENQDVIDGRHCHHKRWDDPDLNTILPVVSRATE